MLNRILWIVISVQGIAGPAFADARDDVIAASQRCAVYTDPRTWLDCYYGAAQPMRVQLGLMPAPKSQTDLAMVASRVAPEAYASESAPQRPTETANGLAGWFDRILGKGSPEGHWQELTSYSFDAHGLFAIQLADGSTWLQMPSDRSRARLTAPPNFYRAIVLAGRSGEFTMRIGGGIGLFSVQVSARARQ